MTLGKLLLVEDCADDSPYFRSQVTHLEDATDDLERGMRRIGAICRERRDLWKRDCALSLELRSIAEGFMKRHVETTYPSTSSTSSPTAVTDSDNVLDEDSQNMLDCVEQAVSCMRQLDDYRERFHEQVTVAVVEPLRKFVSDRIKEVRMLGQQFRDANNEVAAAVDKLCACKKHELSAMAEASSALHEARLQQHVHANSYALALNSLHRDKQPHFVQSILDFVMCEMTAFRLGNSTFAGLDETVSSTYTTLGQISDKWSAAQSQDCAKSSTELANTMTRRLIQLETFQHVDLHFPANTAAANVERLLADTKRRYGKLFPVTEQVKMGRKSNVTPSHSGENVQVLSKSGYLFHAEHRPVVGTSWHRQFFEIEAGWLHTVSEGDALMKQFHVEPVPTKRDKHSVNVDLRLCLVKPPLPTDTERNFCFRVIHPSQTLLLQAESSAEMNEWVSALQGAAARALDISQPVGSSPPSPELSRSVADSVSVNTVGTQRTGSDGDPPVGIMTVDGNAVCADCATASPRWASVNLGVTLCIECSGIHRSLGTHISQVRSLTLDEMRPEWTTALTDVGNNCSNQVYEAFLPPGFNRQFASAADRRLFIKQKYVEMVFAEDEQREKILAERELQRATLAQERERAEEERQQWELVEPADTNTLAVSSEKPQPASPSVFRRMRNTLLGNTS